MLAKLPYDARVMTWGEEVYFDVPVQAAREKDARAVVTPGEVAYWPDGPCIALGYGRTPISKATKRGSQARAIFSARLLGDAKALAKVKAGAKVTVRLAD